MFEISQFLCLTFVAEEKTKTVRQKARMRGAPVADVVDEVDHGSAGGWVGGCLGACECMRVHGGA